MYTVHFVVVARDLTRDTIVSSDCISKVSVGTEKYSKTRTNEGRTRKEGDSQKKRERERKRIV